MKSMHEPRRERVRLGGLSHTLYHWDQSSDTTILFLHGFLDVGLGWSFVVESIADRGWNCVALEWRGHGESEHIGAGGYYHFIDYVRDLEDCVRHLNSDRLFVVGHSMGAMALTLWLGSTEQSVAGTILVEALGPIPLGDDDGVARIQTWLKQLNQISASRSFSSIERVSDRLRRVYPTVSSQRVERIARWATQRDAQGYTWRYDPLHKTTSPLPISESQAISLWKRVPEPLLWIGGASSPWRGARLDWWLGLRPNLKQEHLPTAGHMLQYESPIELGKRIALFVEQT